MRSSDISLFYNKVSNVSRSLSCASLSQNLKSNHCKSGTQAREPLGDAGDRTCFLASPRFAQSLGTGRSSRPGQRSALLAGSALGNPHGKEKGRAADHTWPGGQAVPDAGPGTTGAHGGGRATTAGDARSGSSDVPASLPHKSTYPRAPALQTHPLAVTLSAPGKPEHSLSPLLGSTPSPLAGGGSSGRSWFPPVPGSVFLGIFSSIPFTPNASGQDQF